MKNARLLACAIAGALLAPAMLLAVPVVSNVTASQRPSGDRAVEISYDLAGGAGPMTVSLLVSNDDGATYSITPQPQHLTGDVGAGIGNGTGHTIVWDAIADVPAIYWPGTRVRVIATEEGGPPGSLVITSTLAAGSVSQTREQTLTFTFGAPVTGFDASDVALTGAAKGAFSGSGSVYTLAVTGTGGTITASVAQDAVSPGNDAATFSNFYQDTWTLNLPGSVPMELIRIPAGTFTMGSPGDELSRGSDETLHQVTLTQDFYLGRTEVTQDQWAALQSFPEAQSFVGGTMPVQNVSWNDISSWITALDTHVIEPGTFSLPTESQWEYACRAGTTTRFNFGDGFGADESCSAEAERTDNMWYCGNNSPAGTKAVGQKPANAWGLHDMHGNVWEWCSDWYDTYPGTVADPTGPVTGSSRVIRGGVWSTDARECRSAQRNNSSPTFRLNGIGFRVLAFRPVPLAITSSETAPVHQAATQTLTFTFGADVTGFDASDVDLTGVTKGAFTAVSASVYTLEVTGNGGKVTASVAAGAAHAPAPFTRTAAATFSNFHQDTWTITLPGSVPMELIRIPAGTFTMGSPEDELSRGSEETEHQVTLTQDFYLARTEVTQDQWAALQSFPLAQSFVGGTMPVHRVSHDDVGSWMTALNTHVTEPGTFNLPTESQWEYACRAGTTTRYNFGDAFGADESCSAEVERTNNMWYCGNNSPDGTKIVGQKAPNAWGLHDMHGNVAEWCSDWYGTYPGTVTDPTGPETGSQRVLRGGNWGATAHSLRSATRMSIPPPLATNFLGFRVAAARPTTLAITSSETAPVHETATQTLTFTFGADVTGFDASDVTLTGATKGSFDAVSPSVYTLEVTGTGGTVTASVAAAAAIPPAPSTGTAAATFSNFYQDTWTITLPGSVPMELVRIPTGTFTMGSPVSELSRGSDETQHLVTLAQGFYLGRTEVMQDQWEALQSFPRAQSFVGGTMPVHNVSWNDVASWITALDSHVTGPGIFSLPTESQWEYACRAGTTTRFNFGDGPGTDDACSLGGGREDNMWYCGNAGLSTQLVGRKPPNAWGLHDMHGNVSEWCSDRYGPYPAGPVTDPVGAAAGSGRVVRGGNWDDGASQCRSARRTSGPPTERKAYLGFRVMASRSAHLAITSSEPAPVHETAQQTLTFAFESDVTGFDASDITLTGAMAGALIQVSPREYTLEVTAQGGTMTVDVPANAAQVPAPLQGTTAATFSNFYQDTWTITLPGSVPMELVRIPAGTFTMGSPIDELSRGSDETQHEVTISQDFYLGRTEVTQQQWLAVEGSWPGARPSPQYGFGNDFPAYYVSHDHIQSFLANLNEAVTEPGTFSLPTESQWEYACRAGTSTRFNYGDGFGADEDCSAEAERTNAMWYCGNNSVMGTKAVGQKPANAWGLWDMHGNVAEWCADWGGTYPAGPVIDPTGPDSGSARIVRGGAWTSDARHCRSARRFGYSPLHQDFDVGFRVHAVR